MSDPKTRNNVSVRGNLDSAQTIVFVHGFGTDQTAWRAVAEPFMRDFRIVLLDNVGAGHADPTAFVQHRYLNLTRYADDLIEVCQSLRLKNAIVVGHSAGAMIAVLAAEKAPDVFARLVLIGASPRYLNADGYFGGFEKADIDAVYASVALDFAAWAQSYGGTMIGRMASDQEHRTFVASIRALPSDRALTVLCSILQSDHRDAVKALKQPTLIVQTRLNLAVPQQVAEYLHANIANSELVVIDTEGHLPHITAAPAVISAMHPFLYNS